MKTTGSLMVIAAALVLAACTNSGTATHAKPAGTAAVPVEQPADPPEPKPSPPGEALPKDLAVAPDDDRSLCSLGLAQYYQGNFKEAAHALARAIAINPKNATAHNYLGIVTYERDWDRERARPAAQKEFATAIELDPSYADPYLHLAGILSKPPAKMKSARRAYQRAIELGATPDPKIEQLIKPLPFEDDSPDVLDGIIVANIDASARQTFGIGEELEGVVITEIQPLSPCAAAGLKVGDVMQEIEHTPVITTKQAVELSEKLMPEKLVQLRVSTKGVSRDVEIKELE